MVQIGSRFFTLQCPKKISAIAMSKKIITGRSVVCVVNFILLFFGNWNCVWLVYSTADCTDLYFQLSNLFVRWSCVKIEKGPKVFFSIHMLFTFQF